LETTRHDYADDDCGKCKLRKELRARKEDLLDYLKRQDDDAELDATMHGKDEPSPILLEEIEEDFVLYRDEEDECQNHAAASGGNSGKSIEGEKDVDFSHHQALRIIDSGEMVYSHEEEDGERRKRDSTPGPNEEEELLVIEPPRKKRRPKWKTI